MQCCKQLCELSAFSGMNLTSELVTAGNIVINACQNCSYPTSEHGKISAFLKILLLHQQTEQLNFSFAQLRGVGCSFHEVWVFLDSVSRLAHSKCLPCLNFKKINCSASASSLSVMLRRSDYHTVPQQCRQLREIYKFCLQQFDSCNRLGLPSCYSRETRSCVATRRDAKCSGMSIINSKFSDLGI